VTRLERLAALLEHPLLVAGPPYVLGGQANVRYLTGLSSSNSAVLVEPDATATLYADFRYAARGREVDGVTFVETARSLLPSIAELLAGRRIALSRISSRTRATGCFSTAVSTPCRRAGSSSRSGL